MQLRSKPAVFAIAALLGAGLAVPGALALTGSSSDAPTKPASVQSVEQTHEADAAEQHEATTSEQTATNDQTKTDATNADSQTANPKAFGVTGDEHRSDTAAKHSQADCHRATGPGQPADGSKCTTAPQATANHDATQAKGDDDATEVENENETTEVEKDDEATEVNNDQSGTTDNSGSGSTNSGHGSSHSGSDD